MKLTPSQIETIELYLLSHELRDRDFYNEMLDHFIVTLENKLDEGEEFDYAFPELTHEFKEHKYKFISPVIYAVDGLKAMEHKFIFQKVMNLKNGFFERIFKSTCVSHFSAFLLFISPMSLVHYCGYEQWGIKYVFVASLVLFAVSVGLLVYASYGKKSAISYKAETEIMKAKHLKNMDDSYLLESIFGLILGAIFILVPIDFFPTKVMAFVVLGILSFMAFVIYRNVIVTKRIFL